MEVEEGAKVVDKAGQKSAPNHRRGTAPQHDGRRDAPAMRELRDGISEVNFPSPRSMK
jgi:hypothetical protein